MSISNCARCDGYVDTDEQEMVEIDGKEVCEPCADLIDDEREALSDAIEDEARDLLNNNSSYGT